AVYFYTNEQLVHHRRGGGMLEALVRHHVAPVAGAVADRQQDRLVLRARGGERLRTPWPPIDGGGPVLAQIGAGFVCEAVHWCGGGWGLLAFASRFMGGV